MSVVNVQLERAFPPAAVFTGYSALAAAGAGEQRGGALIAGATVISATELSGAGAAFSCSTALAAAGRVNDEPNVFGAADVPGASTFTPSPSTRIGAVALIGGRTTFVAEASALSPEDTGFTIFVDVLGAGFAAANVRRYKARLTADGVELPVRSIAESAPRGALGVSLEVELAKTDRSLVSSSSDLQFEIGVWTGADYDWQTVMEGGKLAGLLARYANANGRPADLVSFSTLDALGDRWTLAPAAPETLYDPELTDEPAAPDARSAIRDERGAAILPVNTAVAGLTLKEVLRRAYVEGCGFSRVVTNLPDFNVPTATFSLEGGYHGGVLPLVSLFEPLYFADGDELWIVDADAPLPEGLSADLLTDAQLQAVDDQLPPRQPITALVVEYRDTAALGDYFTERLAQESSEAGTFGSPGYTKTETTRRVREYRSLTAPEVIVREVVISAETQTLDYQFQVTGREKQEDKFDALGRKTGHTRKIEALVPDLEQDGELILQSVEDETYTISYRPGARPGADDIARTTREISGLVLVDEDKPYLGKPYELPLLDAHHSGYVDPDANQTAEYKAIRTEIETYVREGGAVEVRRQVSNHLNGGTVERPSSATRAGSTAVNRKSQGVVRRLLTLDGTSGAGGRTVPTVNAGDLPGDLAITYGRRKLARLNNPPRQVAIQIPYIDWRVRRGKVFEVFGRGSVSLGLFIVEGYARRITMLDSGAAEFSMTLQARQVVAAEAAAGVPTVFTMSVTAGDESAVFTVPVTPAAGQYLTADASASVQVTARRTGSGDAFADLAAAPIALTPYAGSTLDFDIKVLAAEAQGITRVALPVRVTYTP